MSPVGPLLLINGPDVVIMLYWAPDGSCYCIMYRFGGREEKMRKRKRKEKKRKERIRKVE